MARSFFWSPSLLYTVSSSLSFALILYLPSHSISSAVLLAEKHENRISIFFLAYPHQYTLEYSLTLLIIAVTQLSIGWTNEHFIRSIRLTELVMCLVCLLYINTPKVFIAKHVYMHIRYSRPTSRFWLHAMRLESDTNRDTKLFPENLRNFQKVIKMSFFSACRFSRL